MSSASSPTFIAYVYGGWHRSPWRDNFSEWDLFENFRPYFPGHPEPFRPLKGMYDDSDPETASYQVKVASTYGISAFSYFLYRDRDGFVMDTPIRHAFSVAPEISPDFRVCLSWCLRLPHQRLPIPADFAEYRRLGLLETTRSTGAANVATGDVLEIFGDRRMQDELPISVLIRAEIHQEEI